MPKVTQVSRRKADHIRINLEEDVRSGVTTGLERLQFEHNALRADGDRVLGRLIDLVRGRA